MNKPDFLGIGAAKAGTTTMTRLLSEHPEISFPTGFRKELHFFDEFYNEDDVEKSLKWYFDQFEDEGVVGEFTPNYLNRAECLGRIKSALPDVKLIVSLRNPVDRAISQYWHAAMHYGKPDFVERGFEIEDRDIEEALAPENIDMDRCEPEVVQNYFEGGLYYKQLKPYYDNFPADNIKVVLFEEFVKDQQPIMKEMYNFLGVDPEFNAGSLGIQLNIASKGDLPLDMRLQLVDMYKRQNEGLEKLINKNLDIWNA